MSYSTGSEILYAKATAGVFTSPEALTWDAPVFSEGLNISQVSATQYQLEPGYTYELLAHVSGTSLDSVVTHITWVTATLTPAGVLNSVGSWNSTSAFQKVDALAVITPLVPTTVFVEFTAAVPASGDQSQFDASGYVRIRKI